MNNAQYGITLQSIICKKYKLPLYESAKKQFKANVNKEFIPELEPVVKRIFDELNTEPKEYLTYDIDGKKGMHNFLLKNGKTLSVKTSFTSDKACPKVVGQAGFPVLNDFFGDVYGKAIVDQGDIKQLMYLHIDQILPTFIDYLFISNYNFFVNRRNLQEIILIRDKDIAEYSFSRKDFTFTRNPDTWTESTTLKYKGISIAEIQVHKNRSFKFRFILSAIPSWFKTVIENNETIGMSAESAVCKIFKLKAPDNFLERSSPVIENELIPVIEKAFSIMPAAVSHTGSEAGARGGRSKSPYDFMLEGGLTLSLKTNKGAMVCPPDVGQPDDITCTKFFSDFLPDGEARVTRDNFKTMVLTHIHQMFPIYLKHMFDCDWLLWIYKRVEAWHFKRICKEQVYDKLWEKERFSFTKATAEDWNESNTVKYDGKTVGEFQVHTNRNCFKFRFKFDNLLEILGL